jgi:phage terminase large subunit
LNYLAQSWLDKANNFKTIAESSPDKYKTHYYYNYIGGWLEKAEGIIFDYVEGDFDFTLSSIYALDWGYYPDPMAISKIAVDTKQMKVYIKEIFCGTENNDVAQIFKQCNISKHELIVCDTNEPRTKANLSQIGYNIQNAEKLWKFSPFCLQVAIRFV